MRFLGLVVKFNDWLEVLITWSLGILMAAIVSLVFTQVVIRYALDITPAWIEEMSRFLMIWIGYIGASLMFRKSGHISVTVFRNFLPYKPRLSMLFLDRIILTGSFAVLIYYSMKLALRYLVRTAVTMDIPMFYIYMLFPISFAFMFFFAIEDIVRLIVAPEKVGQLFRTFEDPELLVSGELDKMQGAQKGGTV